MATPVTGLGPKVVEITISRDSSGNPQCQPDPFRVSKSKDKKRLVVIWNSDDYAQFEVLFNKNGSPFYVDSFNQDRPCSGIVKTDVEPGDKTYEYTVKVGGKTLDPGGRVDP